MKSNATQHWRSFLINNSSCSDEGTSKKNNKKEKLKKNQQSNFLPWVFHIVRDIWRVGLLCISGVFRSRDYMSEIKIKSATPFFILLLYFWIAESVDSKNPPKIKKLYVLRILKALWIDKISRFLIDCFLLFKCGNDLKIHFWNTKKIDFNPQLFALSTSLYLLTWFTTIERVKGTMQEIFQGWAYDKLWTATL